MFLYNFGFFFKLYICQRLIENLNNRGMALIAKIGLTGHVILNLHLQLQSNEKEQSK